MMTDHRMTKRIYTIILTAVLIYGAFFSVMAEIAFAEELAKDGETKTEASSDSKESTQPSSSGSSSSEGDTSYNPNAAEKKSSGTGDGDGSGTKIDDSVSPGPSDQKNIENNDKNEGGSSSSSSDGQGNGSGEVIEEEPAPEEPSAGAGTATGNSDGNGDGKGSDSTKGVDQVKPQTIVVPIVEEPVNKDPYGFTDSRTYRKDGDYTRQVESSGAIRYKGFFHSFDKDAFGTEYLIIKVICRSGQHCSEHEIIHYSDGLCEGLPKGFSVDKNDLIIDASIALQLLKDNHCMLNSINSMNIEIIGNGLLSSISSDPDDSFFEPAYEPVMPNAVNRAEKGKSTPVPSATDNTEGYVSTSTNSTVGNVRASAPVLNESLVNDTVEAGTDTINSVLSSYQNSGDGSVMDATTDKDSPINATTAMLAGVAAMFLITMALVIVPKV